MTAGDRYNLAGRRVGSEVHGSLEALLYLAHPAKVTRNLRWTRRKPLSSSCCSR